MRIASIVLISCLCVWSCSNAPKADDDKMILRVGIESNPTNLDPRIGNDVASSRVHTLVYNGLLRRNEQQDLEPDLAASMPTISEDGTVITVTLRDQILFHNDRFLLPDDVVYTFESMIGEELTSTKKAGYTQLEKVETLSESEVRFTLTEPSPSFLENLTLGIVPRLPENSLTNLSKEPVGTGPYKMVEWKSDQSVRFERFAGYFGEPGKSDAIVYRIIPDDTVRLLELQRGGIDLVVNNIPLDAFKSVARAKHLQALRKVGSNYKYIGFNMEDEITSSPLVRQGIAHAIDREKIINFLLNGYARTAETLLPPGHWAHADDVATYPYNPEKAKELLDSAGFPDPDGDGPQMRFSLTFKTSQDKTANKVAAVIQEHLRKVGVGMEITSYEWGTFFDHIVKGNFQFYSLKWVGITDPDFFYNVFHSSSLPPNGANRGKYRNPQVDELLETARSTLDRSKRAEYYRQVQRMVARDLPYISLWFDENLGLAREGVKGFIMYPTGGFDSLPLVTVE